LATSVSCRRDAGLSVPQKKRRIGGSFENWLIMSSSMVSSSPTVSASISRTDMPPWVRKPS